jgi:hypothetical protein
MFNPLNSPNGGLMKTIIKNNEQRIANLELLFIS